MSSLLLQRLRVSVASCALPRSGSSFFFSTAAAAAVSSSSSSSSPAPGMTPLRLLKPLPKPTKPQAKNKAMATVIRERLLRDKNTRERAAADTELAARVAALPKVVSVVHDLPTAPATASADAASGAAAAPDAVAAAANSSSARFAIIVCGGTQHRVCVGDLIMPNKIHEAIGHEMTFFPLLVGSVGSTLIGRPTIPTIAVRARVEEHTDAAKVLVFKKKRRTGYKRMNGFRAQHTALRIIGIEDL